MYVYLHMYIFKALFAEFSVPISSQPLRQAFHITKINTKWKNPFASR